MPGTDTKILGANQNTHPKHPSTHQNHPKYMPNVPLVNL